jgi:phospholipase C
MSGTRIHYAALLGVTILISSCAGPREALPPAAIEPSDQTSARTPLGRYIKHVVIVIQENRSFDNLFDGFPGADTQSWGYMSTGAQVALQPIPFEVRDMAHYFATGVMDYDNGKMDEFNLNPTTGANTIGQFAYSYLERNEVAPYWTLGKRYVLADHMFPTMFGPSFSAHLTLIAGTADLSPRETEADFPSSEPWGCDAPTGTTTEVVDVSRIESPGPFPCFTQFRTMADTLDAAHVSWKYYAPLVVGGTDNGLLWSAFDAIENVRYGSDWKRRVISPPQQILVDAAKGRLARVSWVVPDFEWSDHPYSGTDYGPSWVASIVNAIGSSPDWQSTAIVVLCDDWGGFYDNVPPPQVDFRGLGIRVGCLIVSPYVRPHVSHTVYEFGSVLKFIEDAFGLPPLGPQSAGYTDTRANSIVDSFDFSKPARAFRPIGAPYPASFFLDYPPSLRAPDEY